MSQQLPELIFASADRAASTPALVSGKDRLTFADLAQQVRSVADGLIELGLQRSERVAVFLDKRVETVVTCFAAAAAGGVFVPVNPLLKPEQVSYILRDCNVRILVTSKERLRALSSVLDACPDLRSVVVVGSSTPLEGHFAWRLVSWDDLFQNAPNPHRWHRTIDGDMAAILYTSGSTGKPKGVCLSHRNMVTGAHSVAQYLENRPGDRILCALPLSFDAGFSQLTTAFHAGACAVLINYLLPKDVVTACEREEITGLTAVPPLWIQLAGLSWPTSVQNRLRYIANTGGRMPRATLDTLRAALPKTAPYLMYGLTEAFRSTYLPPSEVDNRPDSIGKAIPNAEILVVREDGSICEPDEPGELVHRGALVSLGYWNDPEKTAERFKPAPGQPSGLVMPEIAVWSGDTVKTDADGFIYFVGRRDEMIKTSGYRVSPTEIEETVYGFREVGEVAAFGQPHSTLGQSIVVVVTPKAGMSLTSADVLAHCRLHLPAFMVPAEVHVRTGSLPRNPNGKIDRKSIAADFSTPRAGLPS